MKIHHLILQIRFINYEVDMERKKFLNFNFLILVVLGLTFVPEKPAFAQSDTEKVTLDLTLSPALENAQLLGLASLGVDNKGTGPVLVSGTLINNTNELLTNLFFEFSIVGSKVGVIAEITQQAAYPFTLDPGQVVFGDNNDIQNEAIPGIEETMRFDGGLTQAGEDFIENLSGSTTLPSDNYTFSVTISQVTSALGKQVLASQAIELGGADGVVLDEKSIFLKTPGDVIGAEVNITNPFPQFNWEGDASAEYRVIVVRADGQNSPESLIESAKSTESTQNGGSLLQFENLDATVIGNSYQYPASGAQALVAGQTYYWQVITLIQTAVGAEELTSEVWSFKLASPSEATTLVEIDQETFDILVRLVGEEQYAELTESGYSFEGIEANNQIVSGIAALQLLAEIIQKIEDGDIILNSN